MDAFNKKTITQFRLQSQQLSASQLSSPQGLAAWFGAMQAQDFAMAKWALGIRIPGLTEAAVNQALDRGDILRTHVLRPTWHLVAAVDIYWMLELSAPQINAGMKGRHRELELSDVIVKKSRKVIEKAFSRETFLNRDELARQLNAAGIRTEEQRLSHLLMLAELEGLLCSGLSGGNKSTYSFLPARVKHPGSVSREEALAKLAHRYFQSHCPATVGDFAWWSGLSLTDARKALEAVRGQFVAEKWGAETYFFSPSLSRVTGTKRSLYLLPAFDEYIISYRDRSAALPEDAYKTVISKNGMFWPVVVRNGQVTGTWKRAVKSRQVEVETNLFLPESFSAGDQKLLLKAARRYGEFLGKEAMLPVSQALL